MRNIVILTIIFVTLQQFAAKNTILQKIIRLNKAPDLRPLKKSLGYIEDTYLNFTELTNKYGYPTETHTVTTEDGYILTVFRIPSRCSEVKRYPILLMHGIIDSADAWVLTGPEDGLGFILANKCFDVWVPNHRGNNYSRKHLRLNPDLDAKFWDFSFEEIGIQDLPTFIDYILKITNKRKLIYLGHSQGTTDFFVMGSLRPEYNDKIQLSIALAPVAWLKHLRSPVALLAVKFFNQIQALIETVGIQELAAKQEYLPHELFEFLCQVAPLEICGTAFLFNVGEQYGVIKPKTLSVVFGHIPVGVSVKTLYHFGQLAISKKFQRYDDGNLKNIKLYGSETPPQYNLNFISSPIVLIAARNDFLSDLKDVQILASKLPNLLETYVVSNPKWSHNDHLWGTNATNLVYSKVLEYLEDYNIK